MAGSTVNAAHGKAPGIPGTTAKATVAAGGTSAAVQIRAAPPANQYNLPALICVSASESAAGPGIHIVFGDVSVGAPTAADHTVKQADGQNLWTIPPGVTHYRIFGEGTSAGSVYIYVCE
ncbi:MAG TPA: hypothetical protein VJ793_09050 [Anaerolineae bacterium]|nr:hypothetical protein [Anaerolineae bacterium]